MSAIKKEKREMEEKGKETIKFFYRPEKWNFLYLPLKKGEDEKVNDGELVKERDLRVIIFARGEKRREAKKTMMQSKLRTNVEWKVKSVIEWFWWRKLAGDGNFIWFLKQVIFS